MSISLVMNSYKKIIFITSTDSADTKREGFIDKMCQGKEHVQWQRIY